MSCFEMNVLSHFIPLFTLFLKFQLSTFLVLDDNFGTSY